MTRKINTILNFIFLRKNYSDSDLSETLFFFLLNSKTSLNVIYFKGKNFRVRPM